MDNVISFLEQEEPYQGLSILVGRGEGANLTAAHAAAAAGSPSALGWFGGGRRVCQVWDGVDVEVGWVTVALWKGRLNVKSASEVVLQPSEGCRSLGNCLEAKAMSLGTSSFPPVGP